VQGSVGAIGAQGPVGAVDRWTSFRELSVRIQQSRHSAFRDALIQAGVPSSKIQSGAYGDATLARDRRVEVLISTSK
jgi:hypothetical protein